MAITHAQAAEVVDLFSLGPPPSGPATTTLLKTPDVEVMRMVLPAGKDVPSHAVPREMIIQCLEGRIEVHTDEGHCTLAAGQLLYFLGQQAYGLHATVASTVLLTILLEHKAEPRTQAA